uniref:F-box domain-containing protein n=1 Tax=Caenorhabditis tropicalis TaxID=1561998 RepID=A0A1I7TAC6_9PELO
MKTEEKPELGSLPTEVLCHLFTYIPPFQLITKVSLVCQRFNGIIRDKVYWNTRIKNEHQVRLPPCELKHEEYEPKKSFYEMHQQTKRWQNWESQRIVTAPGHCATVDSVLLFEKTIRNSVFLEVVIERFVSGMSITLNGELIQLRIHGQWHKTIWLIWDGFGIWLVMQTLRDSTRRHGIRQLKAGRSPTTEQFRI